mgnify:CR=1 FL=1
MLTAPPVIAPPVSRPPATMPTATEPPNSDPRAQSVLLVGGDVRDWTICEPRMNGWDSSGRPNCPQVDLVRAVDAHQRIQTEVALAETSSTAW